MGNYQGKGQKRSFSKNSNNQGNRRNYSSYRSKSRNSRRYSKPKKKIDSKLYINSITIQDKSSNDEYIGKSYAEYKFLPTLTSNLKQKGFTTTTKIQEMTIPMILGGKNVLGISETGSGKTGAFLIPMVQKLLQKNSDKLIIVAPTRELAQQIAKEAVSFIRGTHIQLSIIIGGESMHRQISQLKKGADIIVGTPGRIKDLIDRGLIRTEMYNNVVIDEVDRMLDMGFVDDIRYIYSKLSDEKQSLFFSATLNTRVEKIVQSLCNNYELVKLSNNTPISSVKQDIIAFQRIEEKIDLLQDLLRKDEVEKAIIFVDTKRYADSVDKVLYKNRFKVGVIHGDKRQNVRKRVITSFKYSKINILVATNVAARGLDIDDITHVINLDEPQTYDEYIHRIGRTGRNGSTGTAYTFVRK